MSALNWRNLKIHISVHPSGPFALVGKSALWSGLNGNIAVTGISSVYLNSWFLHLSLQWKLEWSCMFHARHDLFDKYMCTLSHFLVGCCSHHLLYWSGNVCRHAFKPGKLWLYVSGHLDALQKSIFWNVNLPSVTGRVTNASKNYLTQRVHW